MLTSSTPTATDQKIATRMRSRLAMSARSWAVMGSGRRSTPRALAEAGVGGTTMELEELDGTEKSAGGGSTGDGEEPSAWVVGTGLVAP